MPAEIPVFSAVVPCYNEAGNVAAVAGRFAGIAPAGSELVLVNNGSSDATGAEIAKAAARHQCVTPVEVPVHRGYGFGILCGLRAARGQWLGWTHGDMQCDPADLAAALRAARGAGTARVLVKGLRRGRSAGERFFTAGMAFFESLLFGARLWDINAQPCVFHRSFFDTWQSPPHDFTLDLYACALASRQGLTVIRLPVELARRGSGRSSWNRGLASQLSLSWRVMKASLFMRGRL